MDVKYKVEAQKLQASNHLFLDQLTFGDKVDSPTATKLPVLLAVSLLKNTRGEIDINLPISGSLDDPKFSVGGIIVQVIVNLLTKVVTAPFALLAVRLRGRRGTRLRRVRAGSRDARRRTGEAPRHAGQGAERPPRPEARHHRPRRTDQRTRTACGERSTSPSCAPRRCAS